MGRWALLGGWLMAVAQAAQAAAPAGAPDVEAFFKPAAIDDAELSPSGRYIAMQVAGVHGHVVLGVFDVEDLAHPKIAASFSDADVIDVSWVNDQRLVFHITDQQLAAGERFGPGLWAVDRDGGHLRRLIKSHRGFLTEASAITDRTLSWDHELSDVLHDGSPDVIVSHWHLDNAHWEYDSATLLRLDTLTGQARALSPNLPAGTRNFTLDEDGRPRAAWTLQNGVGRLYWLDQPSGRWEPLQEDPEGAVARSVIPMRVDGQGRLYVVASDRNAANTFSLYRYDVAGKHIEQPALVSLAGFDFRGSLVFSKDRTRLLGVRYESDAPGTFWLDAERKAVQAEVDARLPSLVNQLSFCDQCEQPRKVLVQSASDRQSDVFWLYDIASKDLQRLGASRPWLDARQMAQRDFFRMRTRDGMEMPVWTTRPAGAGPWPTVVLVHGGPMMRGGHWTWEPESQFLASRGYLVVEPEFRGSAGYGHRWLRAGFKQWGLAMQDDVADSARWAIDKGWARAGRICIAGASYGGYATLMGLVRDPDLYRCGVEWAGVTDLGLMSSITWSDLSDSWIHYGLPIVIGDPKRDAERFKATSPIEQAARIKAPLLMAYGGEDYRVPIEHGKRLLSALEDTNPQVEWLVYPDEGHGFFKPENRYDFWRHVERFLARHLDGDAAAATGKP